MTLSKERRRAADAFFRKRAGNGKPPLGVSTVASSSLKRWPPGRLAEVAEGLAERSGRQIMIFAGPQERASTDLVAHLKNSGPVLHANNLHLLDTAALLERCALLICNDTGLMHMAGAVGTPLVALFGPTAEAIYLPPCPACKGFSSALACPYRKTGVFGPSVCLVQGRCLIKKRSCIETIPAEAVLSAAAQMLAEPPAPERHG